MRNFVIVAQGGKLSMSDASHQSAGCQDASSAVTNVDRVATDHLKMKVRMAGGVVFRFCGSFGAIDGVVGSDGLSLCGANGVGDQSLGPACSGTAQLDCFQRVADVSQWYQQRSQKG